MIAILMATYNGETYIAQQIDSLLNQSVNDFKLEIQDDCSNDRTWDILKEYESNNPDKIRVSRLEKNTGSPKYNFISLMSRSKDDYVMLCDQDDVWLTDKIEKTLEKMKEAEHRHGKDVPLLVHTDLCVVDRDLNVINPSFRKAMNANYNRTRLKDQLIQNTLTGCSVMYNRALAELISERPPEYMVMHDWWLMLIASAFGHISHIEDATVLYRQHEQNEVGAKDVRTIRYKINKLIHYREVKEALQNTYRQAESFLRHYKGRLSADQAALLSEYCEIPRKNKIGRWIAICRLGVLKNGIARKIANFIFI